MKDFRYILSFFYKYRIHLDITSDAFYSVLSLVRALYFLRHVLSKGGVVFFVGSVVGYGYLLPFFTASAVVKKHRFFSSWVAGTFTNNKVTLDFCPDLVILLDDPSKMLSTLHECSLINIPVIAFSSSSNSFVSSYPLFFQGSKLRIQFLCFYLFFMELSKLFYIL